MDVTSGASGGIQEGNRPHVAWAPLVDVSASSRVTLPARRGHPNQALRFRPYSASPPASRGSSGLVATRLSPLRSPRPLTSTTRRSESHGYGSGGTGFSDLSTIPLDHTQRGRTPSGHYMCSPPPSAATSPHARTIGPYLFPDSSPTTSASAHSSSGARSYGGYHSASGLGGSLGATPEGSSPSRGPPVALLPTPRVHFRDSPSSPSPPPQQRADRLAGVRILGLRPSSPTPAPSAPPSPRTESVTGVRILGVRPPSSSSSG